MENHGRIYQAILDAVTSGRLIQPFRSSDIGKACPGFAENTYKNFLAKHAQGNPSNATELFKRVQRGLYCLVPYAGETSASNHTCSDTEPTTPFDAKRDQYVELLEPLFLPADVLASYLSSLDPRLNLRQTKNVPAGSPFARW